MYISFYKALRVRLLKVALLILTLGIAAPVFSHELGLQLYSLRNQMEKDLPTAFQQINSWGIKVAEGGGALYGYPLDEYKSLLTKNHIQVVSVDTSFEEVRDNPMAVVYKAKYFGSRYATVYWIPHDPVKGFGIDDAKTAVAVFNTAGKRLEANGITLQYHPHGYEFLPYEDGTILDYMLDNITQAAFQMDVFWMKQGGMDPTKILQKYPGRFLSLHLKDRKKGTENSSDGAADKEASVILGSGDVGIASVVAEAKKQGIRYFFIEDESKKVISQIPQSLEYLKQLEAQMHH
jgi:sugar phosphate isomerase/epimerase